MKILFTFILIVSLTLNVEAQSETEIIAKANELIAAKKYETAFSLLDSFDKKNAKPDIVLLKEEIVLNYFVTSIMHQMFALIDIKPHEDIMDYRGKEGAFSMHLFEPDKILDSLIKIYPDNCKLYKGLGEYYNEVNLRYAGRWLKSDQEVLSLMQQSFTKAIAGNCADYLSYYSMGYITLVQEKYKESIPYFLKSIELKNDYPSAHYNLGYAYLFTDDRQNALKYAKNALDLYTDQTYKSDAARMLGQIYLELNDDLNALTNYELADQIDPGNYYNIKPLLNLYVKTNDKKTGAVTEQFFRLAPTNPTIYNDLEAIYYRHKKEDQLIVFYKEQLVNFKNDNNVEGSLNFYLGKIYLITDKKLAKEHLLKAKDQLSKVYKPNHQVFKAIEDGLKEAESK